MEGSVSTLSWESEGKFLLATLSDAQKMVVIKFTESRQTRQKVKVIKCDYSTEFTAKIHPTDESILTAESTSPIISVWREDKISFDWKVVSTM